jgi:hypothetical protein
MWWQTSVKQKAIGRRILVQGWPPRKKTTDPIQKNNQRRKELGVQLSGRVPTYQA